MDRPGVAIRPAVMDDASVIADLGVRTFRDGFGPENTEADMTAYLRRSFGPEIQAREIADPASRFLISEVDGSAVGYARLKLGEAPACVTGNRPVEIVRFYADTPWIVKGVGALLMAACLDEARRLGCDVIWLGVWERNPRAITFYSKWGFADVGEKEFMLGDDLQHDVVMARSAG
jgi:GNAT superfamily N-acetyltransferase